MLNYYNFIKTRSPDMKVAMDIEPSFKLVLMNDKWMVIPRESYIRKFIRPFKESILARRGLILRPYCGQKQSAIIDAKDNIVDHYFTYPENLIAERVSRLPIFDIGIMVPSMKNGHKSDKDIIRRSYTLESESYTPIACVYFTINLKAKKCFVICLSVDKEKQKGGLGSILIDIVIIVASLYRCKVIELESSDMAVMTYLKHGFYFYEDRTWQHYSTISQSEINDLLKEAEQFSNIPLNLRFDHPETINILRDAFNQYLHPNLDVATALIKQQAIYDKMNVCFSRILSGYQSLLQSWDPFMAQRWLKNVKSFSKNVLIPDLFLSCFDLVMNENDVHQGYEIKHRQESLSVSTKVRSTEKHIKHRS